MTAIDPDTIEQEARKARRFTRINKADAWFQVMGLAWLTPILKAAAGDNPRGQLSEIWRLLGVPVLAIGIFIAAWATLAPTVQTSLGAIPGPVQVWEQAINLNADAVREREKEAAFYVRQDERNAALIAEGNAEDVRDRVYTGKPTYYQQIWTSIKTVFFGFLIGSAIAIPLGIMAGLSATANAAIKTIQPTPNDKRRPVKISGNADGSTSLVIFE
jgi:nitrate/nitrite transport system permease protein